jgi:energy-converting hydrogenase Eha subunit E
MHFLLMGAFAAVVASVMAAIDPERHDPVERLKHGLKIFGLFLAVGVVIGWVLYFIPF